MTPMFGIIRHAPTQWNLDKRIQGRQDIPLSPYGRNLALKWAGQLSGLGFEGLVTSPMKRARQTGQILGRALGLGVVCHPGLEEQDFGRWEGKTLAQIQTADPGEPHRQEQRGWEFTPVGGESRSQLLARVLAAMDALAFQKLLVITHNSVIKALLYHGLGLDFMPGRGWKIQPCHLHWVTPGTGRIVPNALALDPSTCKAGAK